MEAAQARKRQRRNKAEKSNLQSPSSLSTSSSSAPNSSSAIAQVVENGMEEANKLQALKLLLEFGDESDKLSARAALLRYAKDMLVVGHNNNDSTV